MIHAQPFQVRFTVTVGLFICAVIALLPGCRENKPSFEVIPLKGKIEQIDTAKSEIRVLYYNEKRKAEIIGVGRVTQETEIMINGAVATLSDLHPGDRVRGEVRIDKQRGKQTQTVLKIYVDRPQPVGGRK